MADVIAIGLRGLAFAAALLAAGAPVFMRLFGADLARSAQPIRTMAVFVATTALMLTISHAVIEPARLTGELRGIFDGSLHRMLLASDFGTATAVRVLGLGLILGGSLRASRLGELAALIGASLVVVSFAFMGHTATDDRRWLLAPLLIVHLAAVAFWFGGLWPLLLSTGLETASAGGAIVEQFSRVAILLVPMILAAGAAIAGLLLPDLQSLRAPYGVLLLSKIAGFAILMGLAAANRYRFGPGIARGDRIAAKAFRRVVLAEWALIVAVVLVTAAMTALFSPGH